MVFHQETYFENMYVNLKVKWSDSDNWFPVNNLTKNKDGTYDVTNISVTDVLLLLNSIADSTEVQNINILFDDNENLTSLKEDIKVLTGQSARNSRTRTALKLVTSKDDAKRVLSMFNRANLDVTVY